MPLKDWFVEELNPAHRERLEKYLGKSLDRENVSKELIRLAYMSVAKYCVIPMQDLLNLGKESRMNTPGTARGNWEWRMDQLPPAELSLWLWSFRRSTNASTLDGFVDHIVKLIKFFHHFFFCACHQIDVSHFPSVLFFFAVPIELGALHRKNFFSSLFRRRKLRASSTCLRETLAL